jgi:hypothetical protein
VQWAGGDAGVKGAKRRARQLALTKPFGPQSITEWVTVTRPPQLEATHGRYLNIVNQYINAASAFFPLQKNEVKQLIRLRRAQN